MIRRPRYTGQDKKEVSTLLGYILGYPDPIDRLLRIGWYNRALATKVYRKSKIEIPLP